MKNLNRRNFVKMATCGAMGCTTIFNTLVNLKAMNAASIANSAVYAGNDYKALVCLNLGGGNDSFNMLIPKGDNTEYNDYATSRSIHAIPQDDILSLNGSDYGLHPVLTNMQSLFNDNNLAFVANVGTLIEPIDDYNDFNDPFSSLPLGIYSHADQSQQWQTSVPHDRVAIGWGGRVADMLQDMNTNENISMNISLGGNNVFQSGETTSQFSISPINGAETIDAYGQPWLYSEMLTQGVDNIVEATYQDAFKQTYVDITKISRDANIEYSEALDNVTLATAFSDTYASNNMSMVARSLAIRETLGMQRQIFFVDIGGWDMHDELNETHAYNLEMIDTALGEFYTALEELGLTDCVTTFMVSEFARTLSSNGNGTDHGWGGNVMIMGGAVNGGQVFGNYPSLKLGGNNGIDNPLDIGNGVLIPTTSCDEYFAELAIWLGVEPSELSTIFPNIGNFYDVNSSDLPIGFLV